MPPAVLAAAITGAIGVASMASSNAQNKAAIKNNENQQTAGVANAQDATKKAYAQQNAWNQANPTPGQGAIATPPTTAVQPVRHVAAQPTAPLVQNALATYGKLPGAGASSAPATTTPPLATPVAGGLSSEQIQAIMQRVGGQ